MKFMGEENSLVMEVVSREKVSKVLPIWENPTLRLIEKRRFVKQVEHLEIETMADGTKRLSDPEDQQRLSDFCHSVLDGKLNSFEDVVSKLVRSPQERFGLFAPLKEMWDGAFNRTAQVTNRSIRQRDIVENVTNPYRKDHCGQRALMASLIAELFYPDIDAYILPYTRDPTKPLSSNRHYMVLWRDNNAFKHMTYGRDFGSLRIIPFKPRSERDTRRRAKTPLEHLLQNAEKIARSVMRKED